MLMTAEIETKQERVKLRSALMHFFGVAYVADPDSPSDVDVRDVESRLGELGVMICGGAITSLFSGSKINDLDFYMKHSERQVEVEAFLEEFFEISFKSPNAITYKRQGEGRRKWTVQLITRFAGIPKEIFHFFDFTVTQGAFDFSHTFKTDDDNHSELVGGFYLGERFLPDLSKKRLVYSGGSLYPICAMYRTKKYQSRGYTLPGSTLMHIALSVVRLDIHTYKQLKEQLMGIDTIALQGLFAGDNYKEDLPINYGEFIEDVFKELEPDLDE